MPNIGPLELVDRPVDRALIFGPKRLPGLGRQLGSGMREFKDSITGKDKDDDDEAGRGRRRPRSGRRAPSPTRRAAEPEVVDRRGAPRRTSPPRAPTPEQPLARDGASSGRSGTRSG